MLELSFEHGPRTYPQKFSDTVLAACLRSNDYPAFDVARDLVKAGFIRLIAFSRSPFDAVDCIQE